ncbi:MAG: hypothetical protein E7J71_07010 [Clostridium perfringens]|uniref:hypothetical protein n=1 Tax=Clostridium perfringens TaxID=1502 RepID=UPI0023F9BBA7|nr:hypothetical protein [Clostridium perfringens]ELC8383224.1 hypothetical protein [Clostridium perfringens]MDU2657016.1 hypothetical protein [Clostridium perfringens]MDU7844094.1 hypothetical protein [Clostridium perfringens]WEV22561.1 hypothetical protein PL327_02520 [Clostridium perfringens D]
MNKNFDEFILEIKSNGFNRRIYEVINANAKTDIPFTAEGIQQLYSDAVTTGIQTAVEVLREYHNWLNK